MVMPAACEMDRLPEVLLVRLISLTSPIDACRAATVSRAFRAAADSDAVWSRFLPRSLPQFAKGELPRTPMSKKKLFRRLSVQPALFPQKMMGMQLDRATGAERLTLSSRALQTPPRDRGWNWVRADSVSIYSKRDRRFFFSQAAWFFRGNMLEIGAKIQRKILSQNATYAVFMVFKLHRRNYEHDIRIQVASISLAGKESTRQVCLEGYVKDGDGAGDPPHRFISQGYSRDSHVISPLGENVHFPCKRVDGWMEVELGEFQNKEGDSGDEVSISLTEKPQSTMIHVLRVELRSKTLPPTGLQH